MSPNGGGGRGGVAGSQPMSTAVHRSPKKLLRYNSIFNLWDNLLTIGNIALTCRYHRYCICPECNSRGRAGNVYTTEYISVVYTFESRGSQRDVVYFGGPIAPSYMSDRLKRKRQNAGGRVCIAVRMEPN